MGLNPMLQAWKIKMRGVSSSKSLKLPIRELMEYSKAGRVNLFLI